LDIEKMAGAIRLYLYLDYIPQPTLIGEKTSHDQLVFMEYVTCLLCGQDKPRFLYHVHDRNSCEMETFRIVQCPDCGLAFINPRPFEDQIDSFYPPWYHSRLLSGEKLEGSTIFGMPWKEAMRIKARQILKWSPSGRILDVGCGDGLLLAYLKENGWEAFGVETGDITYATKHFDFEIFNGKLEDSPFRHGTFDVISFFHVVEHLHYPFRTLKKAVKLLKPGGVIVIEVPNFASFEAWLFRAAWVGISAPLHLYHFTPISIQALLYQCELHLLDSGFVPQMGKYVGGFSESLRFWLADRGFYPHPWQNAPAARAVDESTTKTNPISRKSFPKRVLSFAEYKAFYIFSSLLERLGFGSNLYAVAKKQ
jgi:SAM-dependent methyltransferase